MARRRRFNSRSAQHYIAAAALTARFASGCATRQPHRPLEKACADRSRQGFLAQLRQAARPAWIICADMRRYIVALSNVTELSLADRARRQCV